MKHLLFLLSLCALLASAMQLRAQDHLLLAEVAVSPSAAEFIEIINPTHAPVALEHYFLADDEDYALLPGASGAGPVPHIGTFDFIAQFPPGATIPPGGVLTIAMNGAGFEATFGFKADFEIRTGDPGTPDMLATDVGSQASITDGGENIVLFFWNGAGDLVQDVDMLNVGTPSSTNDIGNKTGLAVDGPDADNLPSTYLPDAVSMPQQAGDPGHGKSTKRLALESAQETSTGGNGFTGHDETTENIAVTWDGPPFSAPSPGTVEFAFPPVFTVTHSNDAGAGSLRQAIIEANSAISVLPDTIRFALPGSGVHTLQPQSALPVLSDPVVIDGFSQPGASDSSWPPVLAIELDGSALAGSEAGLAIAAGNCTVQGLAIHRFPGAGVLVTAGAGNTLSGNAIFSNGGLGIDLSATGTGGDGVTQNDPGDADSGANGLQNFPMLTTALSDGATTTVTGVLQSEPNTAGFRIEFFASTVCNGDAAGQEATDPRLQYGEGETFLGRTRVATGANGDAALSFTLPAGLNEGIVITATATHPNGSTSEFSGCIRVQQPPAAADYVFLADGKIKIDGFFRSAGNLHANKDIKIHSGKNYTHAGSLTAVRDISIETRNHVAGDATAGDDLYLRGSASVSGETAEHAVVAPIPLPAPSFTAGGPDVVIGRYEQRALAPGSYDRIDVERKGTLLLQSGDYYFNILDTDKSATVYADVSGGPVSLNIIEELDIDDHVTVEVSGGLAASRLLTITSLQKSKIDIGKKARLATSLIAPRAEVHFSKGCDFHGSVCAGSISADRNVVFMHHDSLTVSPKRVTVAAENDVNAADIPNTYRLEQNYPNPFNPSTTIAFALPEAGQVEVAIFSSTGRLVRTLVSRAYPPGEHRLIWDGRDDAGVRVASGVYLYRLIADGFVARRKLVLMK